MLNNLFTKLFLILLVTMLAACAGPRGEQGAPGTVGVPGSSCTVTPTSTGSLVACSDGTYASIDNGQDGDSIVGPQGPAGQNGADSIVQIIDPCGNSPSVIDEVLLKLSDGSYLCYFTNNVNGDYGRLALLPPGSYVTTDGSACHFTITASGTYAGTL